MELTGQSNSAVRREHYQRWLSGGLHLPAGAGFALRTQIWTVALSAETQQMAQPSGMIPANVSGTRRKPKRKGK